jgi:hypothetical protein
MRTIKKSDLQNYDHNQDMTYNNDVITIKKSIMQLLNRLVSQMIINNNRHQLNLIN